MAVGVVVFVVLVLAVAEWWVAAIIGLGIILVLAMIDGLRMTGGMSRGQST
ncbi:MAG TPA: hypothetical protein VG294_14035 [Solirubrobacteraceae bacterium]|nr:hypothetical protein [Solirubrobacteraceae bacterium]